ncbi:thylakoid lumenal 16.5 kDa protein, chloroplastic isoform X1 [Selaginella moellendorffii]|uniref:thylakoid lumenal 16.5 kDa protein, chloroplastic isoform X1 n=1 Tax=Selaginella moellendorffii TaxID=88036 RepID=UPI000D1C466C|nr:thylakoid lumenal 16.5 kDa protein, chloroplastic isoform X1 [Selaginella moellendorffii]|eukprot:XP_024532296.1 thylakoid lumenal 16.5 kDa protein, chloroplastic isoform X1 [Selaginella moellendorffii]
MAGVVAGHGALPLTRANPAPGKLGCHKITIAMASHNASLDKRNPALVISRRAAFSSAAMLSLPLLEAILSRKAAALIEADDDEELLEKVKGDRQKRLEKRETLIGLKDETAYVQNAVYQMSKAGQAIEKDDFVEASNILGAADWVSKTKEAFSKVCGRTQDHKSSFTCLYSMQVSKNSEQQGQAEIFTSSLQTLQTAVSNKDGQSAKVAFFTSATALEKWTSLTGLTEQIKGL